VIGGNLLPLGLRRRRLARSLPSGPLRDFHAVAFPPGGADWRSVEFVALDFETTGIDPQSEDIVSAGWVVVRHAALELATATRRLVRPSKPMPERSAVIHAITDDEAAMGEPLATVLAELLGILAGRVLVAHFAPAERGFLDAGCRRCFGGGLVLPVVDTLQLARSRLEREGRELVRGDLRLDALRSRLGLPDHAMHDALGDALATAELFLAQAEHLAAGGLLPLRTLLRRSVGG
jgi:DNA polymerase-3 subunit epsilon